MIDHFFTNSFPQLIVNEEYMLREQEVSDAADFLHYYADPRVGQFILATKPKNLAEATAEIHYCRSLFYFKKGIYWALTRASDNKMIGAIGVYINTFHNRGEICYDLGFDHWNRGIMTKAMKTAIAYCFHDIGLIRLEATTLKNNASSIALLKKLDFLYEGSLKKYRYHDHHFHDVELYARLTPNVTC